MEEVYERRDMKEEKRKNTKKEKKLKGRYHDREERGKIRDGGFHGLEDILCDWVATVS